MNATSKIARFVVKTEFKKIPSEAVKIAKTAVLDCLGVALAGSKEKERRNLRRDRSPGTRKRRIDRDWTRIQVFGFACGFCQRHRGACARL